MTTCENTALTEQGEAILHRLFEIAQTRLLERGLTLRYESGAIEWLLKRPGWSDRINPLRTLDGFWQHHVANPIEDLIVRGVLARNGSVFVRVDPSSPSSRLVFDVTFSNSTENPVPV
jgi:hypothetical protein